MNADCADGADAHGCEIHAYSSLGIAKICNELVLTLCELMPPEFVSVRLVRCLYFVSTTCATYLSLFVYLYSGARYAPEQPQSTRSYPAIIEDTAFVCKIQKQDGWGVV